MALGVRSKRQKSAQLVAQDKPELAPGSSDPQLYPPLSPFLRALAPSLCTDAYLLRVCGRMWGRLQQLMVKGVLCIHCRGHLHAWRVSACACCVHTPIVEYRARASQNQIGRADEVTEREVGGGGETACRAGSAGRARGLTWSCAPVQGRKNEI